MQVELSVEEIKELLYWHSETPDAGDPADTKMEALKQKLWDVLPEEE